jgi:hypothetical protein
MKCALYALAGAVLCTLVLVAAVGLVQVPFYIAQHLAHVNPMWGLVFWPVAFGAILGAMICKGERS